MAWEETTKPLACHRCDTTFEIGTLVRRLNTLPRIVYCQACAKAQLGEEPPVAIPAPRLTTTAGFGRPTTLTLPPSLAAKLRDFKRAQSGEAGDE
jgi:hypothetical protein